MGLTNEVERGKDTADLFVYPFRMQIEQSQKLNKDASDALRPSTRCRRHRPCRHELRLCRPTQCTPVTRR